MSTCDKRKRGETDKEYLKRCGGSVSIPYDLLYPTYKKPKKDELTDTQPDTDTTDTSTDTSTDSQSDTTTTDTAPTDTVGESLFSPSTKLKDYEKLLVASLSKFMQNKLGFSARITIKKKNSKSLFGDLVLSPAAMSGKITLHYNPNQGWGETLKSLVHELIHAKQVVKGELKPSKDWKSVIWGGKEYTVRYLNKLVKDRDIKSYKNLPWEKEAYSGMNKYYKMFVNSKEFKDLVGHNDNLDYIVSNLDEGLLTEKKWIFFDYPDGVVDEFKARNLQQALDYIKRGYKLGKDQIFVGKNRKSIPKDILQKRSKPILIPQTPSWSLFAHKVVETKWSEKRKRNIDCNNPKGFSEKAHCDGRKKRKNETTMKKVSQQQLQEVQLFLEENCPTDPSKWSYYKNQAKKKFDVYPCVPLDSMAVTEEGLKSYEELELGENILTYNLETEILEWKPIKNLQYFENADLMEIKKSTGFKFRCTPNHKWVIKREEDRKPELIEAKDLTTHMRMVFSANMNESISKSNLLNENWGKHDTWVERIIHMTPSEREVWLSSAIVYDGWEKGKSAKVEGRRTFGFSQKNRDHLLATIYAAYLNGYYVSVNDFDKDVVGVTIIRGKQTHGTQNVIKTYLDTKEDVWCPETENQTWVMVQNGWFTITGNSAYANGWAAKQYKEAGGKWKKCKK